MARALVHLHDRPVRPMVHLDIKPENIFSVNSYSPYDDAAQESSAAVAQMDAMVMSDDTAAHGSPTLSQLGAPTADASAAGISWTYYMYNGYRGPPANPTKGG